MTTSTATIADFLPRFSAKVSEDSSGCWLWLGTQNRNGYGMFMHPDSKRNVAAHRFAYEFAIGPIPKGLVIDHLCRVRHCVNPEHLEPVTQRENLIRGETLVAAALAATHCPQGHDYAGTNVGITTKGHRYCRTCHRQRVAANRERDPEKIRAQARKADAKYRARKRAERAA